MKKIFMLVLTVVSVLILSGCGGQKNVEGKLSDLMTKIDAKLDDDWKTRLMATEVTMDNVENYLGTSDIKFKEALAEEHVTGSVAYSVVLIRTEKNADIEGIKTKIKDNINPRKWICVWVEDEDVIIKNKGDLIIVIVIQDEKVRDIIEKGFDSL